MLWPSPRHFALQIAKKKYHQYFEAKKLLPFMKSASEKRSLVKRVTHFSINPEAQPYQQHTSFYFFPLYVHWFIFTSLLLLQYNSKPHLTFQSLLCHSGPIEHDCLKKLLSWFKLFLKRYLLANLLSNTSWLVIVFFSNDKKS